MTKIDIPRDEQVAALVTRQAYALMKRYGIETIDPRKHLAVTRSEVLLFFRQHIRQAYELLTDPAKRPFHDVLCMEQRGHKFVIYDMDHGVPRSEMFYETIEEAAADFVAFTIGYGYPEGYGFKK